MSYKTTVILAEDELSLGKIIFESLLNKNFDVMYCTDGKQALELYETKDPDILVLDVMMPKKDGFSVAKEIRKSNKTIPILFLTAKSQTKDVVEGFNSGGNDYLKKPFSMEELIVRINNLVQSNKIQKQSNLVSIGQFQFSSHKQKLYLKGKETSLTTRESDLLQQLILHKNEVLEKDFVLNKLWGTNDFFTARSMDVFISKLRKKLKEDSSIEIINVRGYGYKLVY